MCPVRITSSKMPIYPFLLPYTLSFDNRGARIGHKTSFRVMEIAKQKSKKSKNTIRSERPMKWDVFGVRETSVCQFLKMLQVSHFALQTHTWVNTRASQPLSTL